MDSLENLITQALNAGMPRDQVDRFYRSGYVPLPQMLAFHAAARMADKQDQPNLLALGGTRGPGKSHAVLAQIGLDDCQRYPGLKALWLRKVKLSAAESIDDLVRKVLGRLDHHYTPSDGTISFPNGSRILIGGFNSPSDVNRYQGIEYDLLCKEECTQLDERRSQMIDGSIRSTMPGYRERKYYTTNPDGVGLGWFKKMFYLPWKEGREKWTKFFYVSYKANPFISDDYKRYLQSLTGPLAKAWEAGDFDAFEGQAFPEWQHDRNVIKPFEIPDWWPRWRAIDWGYTSPFCCLWFARNPDSRRIFVYRELYATQLTDREQARTIRDYSSDEQYSATYADPSMWKKQSSGIVVTTTADVYAVEGVFLTKADNDRIGGKRKIHTVLADMPDGLPGLMVFENCRNLIRTLPELALDELHPEDVDSSGEDHAYDTLKYGLTVTQSSDRRQVIQKTRSPLEGIGVL